MSSASRTWMYDRLYPNRGGVKPEFYAGVEEFVSVACRSEQFINEGKIRCPCAKCTCRWFFDLDTVKVHLYKKGFMDDYLVWTAHGEVESRADAGGSSSWVNVDEGATSTRYQDMVVDAVGGGYYDNFSEPRVEEPNKDAQNFFSFLESAKLPLWEGSVHSELSLAVRMLSIKSEANQSQNSFDQWASLISEISPTGASVPKDFYQAKKLVSRLGLNAHKIDCCMNGCMLFYREDDQLIDCKFCNAPRYKPKRGGSGRYKNIPHKRMHYLPLIPRLKRLFASMSSAPHMTWHFENRRTDGVMTHPCHGEAWQHFDRCHPDFAADPRNVRLGLCADGFTPNNLFNKPYSCWPVMVTLYNLPPEMCMKDPYVFLTCIIPGPDNPKAKIDVFLQPLVDELKELWYSGVLTYDVARKENFMLRACLMWTINDFPAYGMLSGWMTQGKLACPVCMEDTKAFTLKNGGKNSWFDCHRRFLESDHPFRNNRYAFKRNCVDHEDAPVRLSGRQVWDRVKNLPKITEMGKSVKFPGYGVEHNWTKQSIFWELPYWADNLVRHCIDVMHVEKNICDNIINTVMDTEKTKDNLKARLDLVEYCRRPELHLQETRDGRTCKPKASYVLNQVQRQSVCRWVQELRMPDGYASNLSRCVNVSQGKFQGMKSHDCHVFLECLLPIAFRELPTQVWKPLTELSQFFRELCSVRLSTQDLLVMEQNIPLILAKLERVFPPAFFDSMEHLPVHLGYEARVCGPVQYRWMYPFERYIGALKRTVKNRARVEGSICEAYLSKETSYFCSFYFEPHVHSKRTTVGRNDDGGETSYPATLSIFNQPGRGAGKPTNYWLNEKEKHAAHLHVLLNCDEVQPFREYFSQVNPSETLEEFPSWFQSYVLDNANNITNPHLRSLAWGPTNCAISWPIFFVNGYKFHTLEWGQGKTTYNSGVSVVEDAAEGGENNWYGVLQHILEIEYVGDDPIPKKVVLFSCDWYDPRRPGGTRVHSDYNFIEVNHRRRYTGYDPFIIAQKTRQVYYTRYPGNCKSNWLVVITTKPRGRVESDVVNEEDNAFQAESTGAPKVVVDTGAPPSLRDNAGQDVIFYISRLNITTGNHDDDDAEDEEDSEHSPQQSE